MLGTGAGLIFKGAGFYTTDYKRSSGGDSAGDKKEPEKKSDSKEKKKGDKEPKK